MNIFRRTSRAPSAALLRAAAGAPGGAGRAFTLIEMLIAVGAVGLIAVGLAKLFSSTGEVVKYGRRVSAMNELAATLENQIRRDIAAIAGQGDAFLVIRNKLLLSNPLNADQQGNSSPTLNPDSGIWLSAEDRSFHPRPRRIDEICFFINGSINSAREPQMPGRAPQGAAARIYYGHGMQRNSYDTPRLDSDPLWSNNPAWPAGLGRADNTGTANLYAGNWTLLRQETLLARPQPTQWKYPAIATTPTAYITTNNWDDSIVQVGLQPAAASIFRFDPYHPTQPDLKGPWYVKYTNTTIVNGQSVDHDAAYQLPAVPPNAIARMNDAYAGNNFWPSTASGIVDVAAVDLSVIRARVIGLGPGIAGTPGVPGLADDTLLKRNLPQAVATHLAAGVPLDDLDINRNVAHAQKMLMASALPGNDPWLFANGTMATATQPAAANPVSEQRMIYAPKPPDFTGNFANGGTAWNANEPYRQQDQAMLSSSNLAAGCTEFIVEWSFGDVYLNPQNAGDVNNGHIIWHGRDRSDGSTLRIQPYRGNTSTTGFTGNQYFDAQAFPGTNAAVPAGLIHWPVNIPATGAPPWVGGGLWNAEQPVYSFFGYQEPITGQYDWPWPKLLRFTISLTDPADPTFEQTVQFVVEIPSRQHLQ
jgi:type II secretory pathway pseudopilin PulG